MRNLQPITVVNYKMCIKGSTESGQPKIITQL